MKINSDILYKTIDKTSWCNLQKNTALVSNITTQIIDFYGNPVTQYSYTNPFCQYALENKELSGFCKKCKVRGALEAVQRKKPYIHLCPFDLIEISVPIIIDDEYLGSISGGQVGLLIPEAGEHLEHLVEKRKLEDVLITNEIKKMYNDTPKMVCTDIMKATRMYDSLKDVLVLNIKDKLADTEIAYNSQEDVGCDNTDELKEKNVSSFYNQEIPEKYIPKNRLLLPVFEYVFSNKGENLLLSEAADMAHVSVSYFSRLFAKEVGVNYSIFMNQMKVEWSKQLLRETDFSITQISNDLGFNDSAYFVKTFKRYEGVTPNKYRKIAMGETE